MVEETLLALIDEQIDRLTKVVALLKDEPEGAAPAMPTRPNRRRRKHTMVAAPTSSVSREAPFSKIDRA